ncbi:MAG: BolA family protein [Geminicoccaceae bacterium]
MAMTADEIKSLILKVMPDADIDIQDLAGDGNHYHATITAPDFEGKSRVQQHQLVYRALGERMGGELHALALTTQAPK